MARLDPHSHADSTQPRPRHLRLRLDVSFAKRELEGEAELVFDGPVAGTLDLDTRELEIMAARSDSAGAIPFALGPQDPIVGRRLRLELPPGTRELQIRYRTSPSAPALQWLLPEQTRGGAHPFLFSQCQAIHARALLPARTAPTCGLPTTPR
jgi:leukotriene-A4 hydrolase